MQALENIIIEPKSTAEYALIWLHGLGADGHDFEPIAPQLNLPRVRYVFPHAPVRRVTLNAGMGMRAWYDITALSLDAKEDIEGIRDSQRSIEQLIQQQIEKGVAAENIFLVGFSQGGAMALHTGLRYPKPLAGIIALSAYLPCRHAIANEMKAFQSDTPIFMAHGNADMVLPQLFGEATRDLLVKLGCKIEWHGYSMGHTVCAEEVVDLRNFLHKTIKKAIT